MAAVARGSDEEGNGIYKISAGLVHKVLLSIIGGMLTIAAYMVLWALNDTGWKHSMTERIAAQDKEIAALKVQLSEGVLPVARQQLKELERRMNRVEAHVEKN